MVFLIYMIYRISLLVYYVYLLLLIYINKRNLSLIPITSKNRKKRENAMYMAIKNDYTLGSNLPIPTSPWSPEVKAAAFFV